MPFAPSERQARRAVKGVGPHVIARLEQMSVESLAHRARANAADVLARGAALAGSSCWKNSPQARTAIHGAIAAAQKATRQPRSSGTPSPPNS